ncbi:unnamed protein product [Aureobasidium pullulans]|nr:unnamed protein product [Aureobasidium pullulans]
MADVISFAPQHEEELSDEQMQEMLAQAARRRKENASSVAPVDKDDGVVKAGQFNFPSSTLERWCSLMSRMLEMLRRWTGHACWASRTAGCRTKSARWKILWLSRRRCLRYVVHSLLFFPSFTHFAYEENYPNFFLTRNQVTVLVALCTN